MKRQSSDQLLIKQCQNRWSNLQLEEQQTSVSINGSSVMEDCNPFTNIRATNSSPPKCTFLGVDSRQALSFIHGSHEHQAINPVQTLLPPVCQVSEIVRCLMLIFDPHTSSFSWNLPLRC